MLNCGRDTSRPSPAAERSHTLCSTTRMRKQIARLLPGIILICVAFSGCAYTTKHGRQEMAYRHYVSKHVRQRQRQIARAQAKANREMKVKMRSLPESAPKSTATVEAVPEPTAFSPSDAAEKEAPQQQP